MGKDINLLDSIQIATPCSSSWSVMKGDDRVRFCEQCSLHVYNMAEMTRDEAEKLIVETEGRLCVRLYRRHDGTVITKDCPVGLVIARRKLSSGMIWLSGALTACLSLLSVASGYPIEFYGFSLRDIEPFQRFYELVYPPTHVQGAVALDWNRSSYTARLQVERAYALGESSEYIDDDETESETDLEEDANETDMEDDTDEGESK